MATTKVTKTAKTRSTKPAATKISTKQKGPVEEPKTEAKNPVLSFISGYKPTKITYIVILLIGLLVIAYYKKSWFIAATVNGSVISNFEVLNKLNEQYRTQVLTQMINEKIIKDEVKKNGITVSDSEINNKISQLEANVGGAQALDSLLTQQGQTRANLRDQLNIQLAIEKLYANSATVSAEEVTEFIDKNKDQLQASDSAGQTTEATDILKQQKLSQIFRDKFQQLKQAAKVKTF